MNALRIVLDGPPEAGNALSGFVDVLDEHGRRVPWREHWPNEYRCELVIEQAHNDKASAEWLVWCNSRKLWLSVNQAGLTPHIEDAGRYTLAEAAEILRRHRPTGNVPDVVMVPAPVLGVDGAVTDDSAQAR